MAGTFSADMAKFAKKFGMTLDEAHRGIVISLFSSVVMDTPVDKGQLRGAWNVSEGAADETVTGIKDKSGATTRARIESKAGKAGMVSVLTNPLPYAQVAEYGQWGTKNAGSEKSKVTEQGFSKKSPAGMVRRNVARIQSIVSRAVSKARRTR